nr:hypothetical protein Itr_chr12CG03650 [Ipomoea trifida]
MVTKEAKGTAASAGGHARPDSAICPQVPQAEDEAAEGADTGDDPVLGVRSGLHQLQRAPGGSLLQLRRRHECLPVVPFYNTAAATSASRWFNSLLQLRRCRQ